VREHHEHGDRHDEPDFTDQDQWRLGAFPYVGDVLELAQLPRTVASLVRVPMHSYSIDILGGRSIRGGRGRLRSPRKRSADGPMLAAAYDRKTWNTT